MREFYTKCQKAWMETNSIKDGDLVRILNKVPTGANGWGNSWAGDMDDLVGSVGEVQTYRSLSGVGAAGICVYFSKTNDYYLFPYFALEKVEPKEKEMKKSYKERQAEWILVNGIKAGDNVRLFRTAKNFENGWDNVWPSKVDGLVGKILKVKEISGGNISCYDFETNDWFNFPYFVLEKVVESKDKEWTVSYGLKVKTGDPVLMRDDVTSTWWYSIFSHKLSGEGDPFPYCSAGAISMFCIPYKGNEHLVGTTDDYKAPEKPTKPKFVFGAKVEAVLSSGEEMEGVLIGFDTEDHDSPFEVAVRDEDADLGRIRYWAKEITYID